MNDEPIKGQQTISDLLAETQVEEQEQTEKKKRRKYRGRDEEPAERWFMSVNFTYNSPFDVEMINFLKHIPNKARFVKKLIWFAMKAEDAIDDHYVPYDDELEISEEPEPSEESGESVVLSESVNDVEAPEPPAPKKRGRPRKPSVEVEPVPKRPRGRPRKERTAEDDLPKRPRGRPRKERVETEPAPPKKRGRPRKSTTYWFPPEPETNEAEGEEE